MNRLLNDLLNPGGRRTHAMVTILAGSSLSAAVVILAVAAFCGRAVAGEMSTVCLALGGLVGWVYRVGKTVGAAAPSVPGASVVVPTPAGTSDGDTSSGGAV